MRGSEHGTPGASAARVAGALRARGNASAANWYAGRDGEVATGLALRPMVWLFGARVFHDYQLPNQKTNADHTVFSRRGNFYVDSKQWDRHAELVMRGGALYRDRQPVDFSVSMREAQTIASYCSCRIIPVVVIHGAQVPPLGYTPRTQYGQRIAVVDWRGLWRLVWGSPHRQDEDKVKHLAERFQERFTGYTAGR